MTARIGSPTVGWRLPDACVRPMHFTYNTNIQDSKHHSNGRAIVAYHCSLHYRSLHIIATQPTEAFTFTEIIDETVRYISLFACDLYRHSTRWRWLCLLTYLLISRARRVAACLTVSELWSRDKRTCYVNAPCNAMHATLNQRDNAHFINPQ